jgi:hypothetical protein
MVLVELHQTFALMAVEPEVICGTPFFRYGVTHITCVAVCPMYSVANKTGRSKYSTAAVFATIEEWHRA